MTFKPEPGYFLFDPIALEFDKLAGIYAEHFGAENVIVLPQELLKRDRPLYLRLLLDFVGLKKSDAERQLAELSARGQSPPASGIPLLRFANSFSQNPLNPRSRSRLAPLGKLIERAAYRWTFGEAEADRDIKQAIHSKLRHCYGASNARLQQYSPVELAPLGYELGE